MESNFLKSELEVEKDNYLEEVFSEEEIKVSFNII